MRARGAAGLLLVAIAVIAATGDVVRPTSGEGQPSPSTTLITTSAPAFTNTGPTTAGQPGVDFAHLLTKPCDGLREDQARALGYFQLGIKSNDSGSKTPDWLSCQWFGSNSLLDVSARRGVYDFIQMKGDLGGEIIRLAGRDTFRSSLKGDSVCGLMVALAPDQTLVVILVGERSEGVSTLCDRATAATQAVLANLRM